MKRELLLRPHLGLGDGLICNALVRAHAQSKGVTVLTKHHNVAPLAFQWKDSENINVVGVADDEEADSIVKMVKDHNRDVLSLGYYGTKPFDRWKFDKEFFRQARVEFPSRWNNFKVDRQPSREFELPGKRFVFVHDDPKRGFSIDPDRLPRNRKIVRPEPLPPKDTQYGTEPNIFDYWGWIEAAEEIHVINSSFLILVDSLPCLKAKRFVLHLYARPDGEVPSVAKSWEKLK